MIQVIDVGANYGGFGLELARRNPMASVHLIEPVPELAEMLRKQIASVELANTFVHEIALGSENGQTALNVSTLGDRGTTSMLPFDSHKIASDPYWSQRTDLQHNATAYVQVMRLSNFMEENGIERIDFIKIDVQGLDLDVLASAGDRIGAVHAGMLEVPTTEINALYVGEQQNLRLALNFLEASGLKVMAVKPNDPACNEVNIFFTREPKTWEADTISWGLHNLPAFDGKHYWHAHSASPIYSDELNHQLQAENQRLLMRIDEIDFENKRLEAHIAALNGASVHSRDSLVQCLRERISALHRLLKRH